MTSYIAINNSEIDPNSPITADLMTKLRDNPIAVFMDDASVPASLKISGVNIQAFTASGTYTPTSGYKWGIAFVTGGGASGSSAIGGGGGGSGGTAIGVLNLTTLGAVAVTVGSAGGGASTLSTLTGSGGSGGGASYSGAGGNATGGILNLVGAWGNYTGSDAASGGGSFWGSGGSRSNPRGSGGTGGTTGPNTAIAGVVMIMEFR